jgi:hypothetical protein
MYDMVCLFACITPEINMAITSVRLIAFAARARVCYGKEKRPFTCRSIFTSSPIDDMI